MMMRRIATLMFLLACIGFVRTSFGQEGYVETDVERRLLSMESEIELLRNELAAAKTVGSAPYQEASYSTAAEEAGWVINTNVGLPPCPPATTYPTLKVSGFFHLDSDWFDQNQANIATVGDIQDGSGFRRSRLGVNGKVAENVNYNMEYDFAVSQARFTDVWVNFSEVALLGNVRIGRWRQPFGMDELTSVRELPFLERSLLFSMSPFRQTGVGFYDHSESENMTWAASVIRYQTDNFGNTAGDNGGYGFVGRYTMLPIYQDDGERLVHLGADYYYVDPSLNTTRFASQPEIQIVDSTGFQGNILSSVPPFIDTGVVPTNHVSSYRLEAAAAYGRFYVQSEAQWLQLDQLGGPNQTIEAAYIQGRYILTGEKLPYNRKTGVFGAITPFHDVKPCYGGIGAWEVTARWSYADFNGAWIGANAGPGRQLNDATLGLNWYVNKFTKFQFNYIHAMLNDPTLGDSNANIFAARCQLAF
ncbi:porin [Blastopirellula sp. J2-11]|uniref:OprO/OprP family phosphate-selective porin n=1 Tax=Blastopirellula sp. J2-11 TaxID=2943192 RepID=UPI0021CA26C7|nr:porin [Blastopirellula sp. J2-11]UUO04491.1 porin [Blastopirellula sp. J2-11]